jgi:uncharacterized protein (DUF58 family)
MQSIAAGNQSNQRRRGIEQDEFYALRPWNSGDSLRWIHWRSTAKYGDLTVKQFDQKGDRDFALLLDCWIDQVHVAVDPGQETPPPFVTDERVETALSCTATILSELDHYIKGQVAVSFCGQSVWTATTQAYAQFLAELVKRLAVIRPASQTGFEQGLLQLSAAVSTGTPLTVISTRPRPQLAADAHPSLNAAFKRTDWIQVDTPEFDEVFQFDPERQERELASLFNHQKFVELNVGSSPAHGGEASHVQG